MPDDFEQLDGHCRRLGHNVPFAYCRSADVDRPCPLICDCWWQRFDVVTYLRERLSPAQFAALGQPHAPGKIGSLLEQVAAARRRADRTPPSDA